MPSPASTSNNLTYTITVDNAGPSDAAGVAFIDPLQTGTSFASASDGGTYNFFFFNDTATTEIYTLSLHDALPILVVNVNSSRTANLSNTATVSSSTPDPTPGNNSATE